jgi:hypothetical protein
MAWSWPIRVPIRPVAVLAVPAMLLFCDPERAAGADSYEAARLAYPDLYQTYYDEGLVEYCGLQTPETMRGFAMRRDEVLAATPLSADQFRTVRIAALIKIDYDYQDHGLSGTRQWCRVAGHAAYDRFVARYRAARGNSKEAP